MAHSSSLKPVYNEPKTVRCDPEVRGTKLEFKVKAIFFPCHVDSLSTIVSRFYRCNHLIFSFILRVDEQLISQ